MTISAAEQFAIELINRARLDPAMEAQRYGTSLNANLPAGSISTDARQVLAPNTALHQSAELHSIWMLSEDVFSHTGENDSQAGDRMADAGYVFSGRWAWRENLAWTGTTGEQSLDDAIEAHHIGLYESPGHRLNTFSEEIKEIGLAQVRGDFVLDGVEYDSSMLTLNFGLSGSDSFVTGVAYVDLDGDDFYSIGEGRAGYWISAEGSDVTTLEAGGYGLAVSGAEETLVHIGQGDDELATLLMNMADGNGKLDIVEGSDGELTMLLSTDATLLTGIPDARLLGIADLDLFGNDADNVLTGNRGNNLLSGAGGNDALFGGGGRTDPFEQSADNADDLLGGLGDDYLAGQAGADRLDGGDGDDVLLGGGGRDTFVFTDGHDVVLDFTDNVDLIEFDTDLTLEEILDIGEIVDGNAVFALDIHTSLTLSGIDQIDLLANDIMII